MLPVRGSRSASNTRLNPRRLHWNARLQATVRIIFTQQSDDLDLGAELDHLLYQNDGLIAVGEDIQEHQMGGSAADGAREILGCWVALEAAERDCFYVGLKERVQFLRHGRVGTYDDNSPRTWGLTRWHGDREAVLESVSKQ